MAIVFGFMGGPCTQAYMHTHRHATYANFNCKWLPPLDDWLVGCIDGCVWVGRSVDGVASTDHKSSNRIRIPFQWFDMILTHPLIHAPTHKPNHRWKSPHTLQIFKQNLITSISSRVIPFSVIWQSQSTHQPTHSPTDPTMHVHVCIHGCVIISLGIRQGFPTGSSYLPIDLEG